MPDASATSTSRSPCRAVRRRRSVGFHQGFLTIVSDARPLRGQLSGRVPDLQQASTPPPFSFSLPTADDPLVEGNESYTVSLSAPAIQRRGIASRSAPPACPPPSPTTTPSPSRWGHASVTEGALATYTVTCPIDRCRTPPPRSTSRSPCRAARRRRGSDFTESFLTDCRCAGRSSAGSALGKHPDLQHSYNTSAVQLQPADRRRPPGRGQRELHGLAVARPPPMPAAAAPRSAPPASPPPSTTTTPRRSGWMVRLRLRKAPQPPTTR